MTTAWLTLMPMSVSAELAMPVAKGFTVEPRQPTPAPSRTIMAPLRESYPAAIMVAESRA